MSTGLACGFGDPVFDAQRAFRAVMNALARPGSVQPLGVVLDPPHGLSAGLAAVALTLADHEAPLWLDEGLSVRGDVVDFLRFHTGAAVVDDPAQAAFALVAEPAACPDFAQFVGGTLEYPDRSTTIVLAVQDLRAGAPLALCGPGIAERAVLAATPRPDGFVARWARNGALFPRGVDLIFATASEVVGLPRTTRIIGEA